MLSHHGEVMEVIGAKATVVAYSGAVTSVGSGALVSLGLGITQEQIAFISMVVGAIVGIGGLITSIVFRWLAHKEVVRMNKITEARKIREIVEANKE